jgi:hypothetical protein
MAGVASHSHHEDESPLDEQERLFLEARVDDAIAPYLGSLPAADLAWMRAQILESVRSDPSMRELARAAAPRNVDSSGMLVRRAGSTQDDDDELS